MGAQLFVVFDGFGSVGVALSESIGEVAGDHEH
ncbi:Uncharacterised protein [Mycobacteroides abscessus subsp. abscessus]|nr:Uncharacterised protein [Mycobacteroides abscessus subsp. abscessus]SIK67470.1 Uncharacterised protein [Mycobacteroides abscessus subsp. abscessus]